MAFDPYYYYLDGKRKEQRWASVTPFILVGLLLLVMAIDGYLGYKSVHLKPKPAAEIVTDACSDAAGCNSGTVCHCPEYRHEGEYEGEGVDRLHSTVGIDLAHAWKLPRKHKPRWADDHACYRETFDANGKPWDTVISCPEDEHRRKRKPASPVPPKASDMGSGSNDIGEWTLDKPKPVSGKAVKP